MPIFYLLRYFVVDPSHPLIDNSDNPLGPRSLMSGSSLRYERATLTETPGIYWCFRVGSATNVLVWLRRFIGYPLVGC